MQENNYSLFIEENCCRYCLSNENSSDLVSPCKCSGSSKYVHKECLKQWFTKRNSSIIIPGFLTQYNYSCELCHTNYKIDCKDTIQKSKLWLDMCIYFFAVTTSLITSYILVGLLLNQSENTKFLLLKEGSEWEYIFVNGFVFVHVILGVFYLTTLIIFSLYYDNGNSDTCLCCWVGDCGSCNNCEGGEGCFIILIFFLAIGVLGTILLLYYDVLSRVLQRHYNKSRKIVDVLPYEQ